MLDQNLEAVGHEYFDLGVFDLSPDHSHAAWSADVNGDEHYTMRIRDLSTGVDLTDEIPDTTWAGSAWSRDGQYLFYVTADAQERPFKVWRHRIGDPATADQCIFTEEDERFFLGIGTTRSDEWIVIHAGSKTSAEQWLIPADQPLADPICVRPRTEDLEYELDHWGDQFVILTNLDALDFQVMTAPLEAPGTWTTLIPHEPGQRITGVETFASHLVIHRWANAQPGLVIRERSGETWSVPVMDEPHDVGLGPNPEWTSRRLRFGYQSLTQPATVAELDLDARAQTIIKTTPTPNVDLDMYRAERIWVTAADGVEVPVDLIRHRDTHGPTPVVLYGYGAYEASLPPWFSVARLSLIDRGVTWALAHPRGGGELGRNWYLQGKLLNKATTFTDMIAVGEHLIASRICTPDGLAVRGGSAGGLMVGACVTMRPDLWRAAVAEVPFVDIVSTMSDPTLPLTVTEWEEWGDPRLEPFASYMESYSPYDNTVPADYPAIYITAGLNDPRVSYHEPAKWIAKLRLLRTNDEPLLMRIEMGAGHGGPSGRYESWRDEARVLSFLLSVLTR
jgi:oligopeptidase B